LASSSRRITRMESKLLDFKGKLHSHLDDFFFIFRSFWAGPTGAR